MAKGLYFPDQSFLDDTNSRSATFALKNGVAIYGGFAGSETQLAQRNVAANRTILSGDIDFNDITGGTYIVTSTTNFQGSNSFHVVTGGGVDASARLDGFVVTGGDATADNAQCLLNACGGGIYAFEGSPTLANLTVVGNRATYGGGVYFSGNLAQTLTDSTLSTNFANGFGAGMSAQQSTSLTLTRVHFTKNDAVGYGGGAYLDGEPVTLTDVSFTENKSSGGDSFASGAGIYMVNSAGTLTGVTFTKNQASKRGGGIFMDSGSSATLTTVTFDGNTAESGGGLQFLQDSALSSAATDPALVLDGATFHDNRAKNGGGLFATGSDARLTDVTFSANRADKFGGGAYLVDEHVTLQDVSFSENESTVAAPAGGGGMYLASSESSLTGVTFTKNKALAQGGGLAISSAISTTLNNVTFTENEATDNDTGNGGGMYVSNSDSALTTVTFTKNKAAHLGGGLYMENGSNATLKKATFDSNTSIYGGGGLHFVEGGALRAAAAAPDLVLDEVAFRGNVAYAGGGVNASGGAASLTNVTFTGNLANSYYASGGGAFFENEHVTLQDVAFTENQSTGTYLGGGGGMTLSFSDSTLTRVTFAENKSTTYGGGLRIDPGSNGSTTLKSVTFDSNTSRYGGGFYYLWDGNGISGPSYRPLTLEEVTFRANQAKYGGGMSANNANATLTNVSFVGNRADDPQASQGGGLANYDGSLALINVVFAGNRAMNGVGGALYNLSSDPILTNVTFNGNQAKAGGALYNSFGSLLVQNSILWGNTPNEIFEDSQSAITYRHSLIQGLNPAGEHNVDGTNSANDPKFAKPVSCGSDGCTDNPATTNLNEGANDDYGDLLVKGPAVIDAGDNGADLDGGGAGTKTIGGVASDRAGKPRLVAAKTTVVVVDMGAYEAPVSPPQAEARGPYTVNEGSPLALDGSGSSDDGVIQSYRWDCTNDNMVDVTATSPTGSSCLYSNDGAYTLRLSVSDALNLIASDTAGVTVKNVAPVFTPYVNQSTFAGSATSFNLGSFTDPGAEGSWPVTVNWGDNSSPTHFNANGAGTLPTKSHAYTAAGTFNVVVTVDDGDANDFDGFQVVVNAPQAGAPLVTPPAEQLAKAGVEKRFQLGAFSDPSSSGPWHVTVDWGDNSTKTQFDAAASGTLAGKPHSYQAVGDYDVLVTVSDGALSGGATFKAGVTAESSSGSISGLVFDDANGNRAQDSAEKGVPGAQIRLDTKSVEAGAAMADARTTTTDANGRYQLDNIAPGTYTLSITAPAGYQLVGNGQVDVKVAQGKTTNVPAFTLKAQATNSSTIYLPNLRR